MAPEAYLTAGQQVERPILHQEHDSKQNSSHKPGLSPAQYSLTVQNRGLKHHTFMTEEVLFLLLQLQSGLPVVLTVINNNRPYSSGLAFVSVTLTPGNQPRQNDKFRKCLKTIANVSYQYYSHTLFKPDINNEVNSMHVSGH